MIVIGVDPGLDGAVAIVDSAGAIYVNDTPTGKDGKKRRYLLAEMTHILRHEKNRVGVDGLPKVVGAIERVHSMPKQGVVSCFSFGEGFGIWQGIFSGLGIPFDLIEPQRWKKALLEGAGKDKDAGRIRAQQLFPGLADRLSLKKHHGRADALLIAEYRRRLG